jgi:hypothetical protein
MNNIKKIKEARAMGTRMAMAMDANDISNNTFTITNDDSIGYTYSSTDDIPTHYIRFTSTVI